MVVRESVRAAGLCRTYSPLLCFPLSLSHSVSRGNRPLARVAGGRGVPFDHGGFGCPDQAISAALSSPSPPPVFMGLEMKFRSHGATSATLPHEDDRALVGMFTMTVQMFVLYGTV